MSPAVSAAVIALADVKAYWATFQDTEKDLPMAAVISDTSPTDGRDAPLLGTM
jgi:hypothetical protein